MNPSELPGLVAEYARRSVAQGLNQGASGNISARLGDAFFITPSAREMSGLTARDIVPLPVRVAPHGETNDPFLPTPAPVDALKPSSEWRFHRDIYAAFPEARAIVHAHSPFAVALACLRRDIPPFHYMVAMAGGTDIRCARYATFGTQALSVAVLEALQGRRACLMANHGLLAWGSDLAGALHLALEVEALAGQYLRCLQVGQPVLLEDREMAEVLEKFKDYGRKR